MGHPRHFSDFTSFPRFGWSTPLLVLKGSVGQTRADTFGLGLRIGRGNASGFTVCDSQLLDCSLGRSQAGSMLPDTVGGFEHSTFRPCRE